MDNIISIGRSAVAAFEPQTPGTSPVCSYCKLGKIPSQTVLSAFKSRYAPALGYVGVDHSLRRVILGFGAVLGILTKIMAVDTYSRRWPRELPGSYVFEGLAMRYETIREQAIRQTESAMKQYPNYELVITGHSQGAAYTTFAIYDLGTRHPDWNITAVPTGSPRVGNVAFAEAVNSLKNTTVYRVTYKRDTVVQLPSIEEFVHINTEYFYNDANQFVKCNSYQPYGEDPNCSARYPCEELKWEDHTEYLSDQF
ncbi:alpha/beta-hydrolase [Ramicandelaber brevisporus]|nr:alpha/beta-hydrolase [Ramicandelaber brevisporus]